MKVHDSRWILRDSQKVRSPATKKRSLRTLFLCSCDGECKRQIIGINIYGTVPKEMAEYLGLEDPQRYSGDSFRRISAAILANSGGFSPWNVTKDARRTKWWWDTSKTPWQSSIDPTLKLHGQRRREKILVRPRRSPDRGSQSRCKLVTLTKTTVAVSTFEDWLKSIPAKLFSPGKGKPL